MSARPKLFRDPVYDIIALDLCDPVERVVFDLLDTAEVQRLRRVRQLGMSFLVYHGAEHSRFAHSIGVCHLALRCWDQLFGPGRRRDDLDRLAVAVAALLHDVGHGPFSHVMERITGVHHEAVTAEVVSNPASEVHEVLRTADPSLPGRVLALLQGRADPPFLGELVSSQLDADRMDYILRDRAATGVQIGNYDRARIVGMLDVVDGHLVVRDRALEAVEGYLIARFHMYKQVYLHKATRAAERMLEAAMRRARELARSGALRVSAGHAGLEVLAPSDVFALDDADVWVALKAWSRQDDAILRELAKGLLRRRLYKTVEVDPNDPRGTPGVLAEARAEAARLGFDPDYAVLVDNSTDTPYLPYRPGADTRPIRIVGRHGEVVPIEARSRVVALLGEMTHDVVRLCVHPYLRDAIVRVAGPDSAPRLV